MGHYLGAVTLTILLEGFRDSLGAWERSGSVQAELILSAAPPQGFLEDSLNAGSSSGMAGLPPKGA